MLPEADLEATWAGRLLLFWSPAAAVMAGIFLASSLPNLSGLPGDLSDKTAHFIGYATLGAAMLRGTAQGRWSRVSGGTAAGAWLLSALFGATDEFHQWFVPGRTPSMLDWVADVAGAGVAIGLLLVAASGLRRETRGV